MFRKRRRGAGLGPPAAARCGGKLREKPGAFQRPAAAAVAAAGCNRVRASSAGAHAPHSSHRLWKRALAL